MKKLVLPLMAIFLFSFTAKDYGITEKEREKAIEHLTKTRDHMKAVLDGLTDAQLNFQAAEASWSIAQCVEHLAISETTFNGLIKQTVATGNNPALKDSVKLSDDQLVKIIIDRSNKVKTSEAFEPSGKFGSHKATVDAFIAKRDAHIAYVKTTEDDLRNRFNSNLPFGTVDAYQLLLFTAGHTERHVLQMEEVMNSQLFPEADDE
ncbi:DinB family protein [uncultured Croceitalea sp.]|uniref:DinB family protein n=1 Tax=uncultured Croceitalea sp. TaxID=1798908 RepID=UPI0033059BF9